MAAEQDIYTALQGGAMPGAIPQAGACVVETRLHFDGYEGVSGRVEGRDAAGNSHYAVEIGLVLGSIPCFTADTAVATGKGLVQVGSLTPGMRVITRDNGMQELVWVGRRSFGWKALGLNPLLRPVRIAAGALGQGLPERDMVVSPNHRFLTRQTGQDEGAERLTMARDLVGQEGICHDPVSHVEYWQLVFARHELVLSDGSWSESFRPTPVSLAALDDAGRRSLSVALPGIEDAAVCGFDAVRPFAELGSAA